MCVVFLPNFSPNARCEIKLSALLSYSIKILLHLLLSRHRGCSVTKARRGDGVLWLSEVKGSRSSEARLVAAVMSAGLSCQLTFELKESESHCGQGGAYYWESDQTAGWSDTDWPVLNMFVLTSLSDKGKWKLVNQKRKWITTEDKAQWVMSECLIILLTVSPMLVGVYFPVLHNDNLLICMSWAKSSLSTRRWKDIFCFWVWVC